jgi:bacitracin transport system permease protein
MSSKDENVSLKEIRETYYKLRSFEISNLWQRSIFLSAIIVIFFTAYGYLVKEFMNKETNDLILNEICCFLALFGFIFSIIWIMMAKGSKAWYEVYENNICTIERENELKIPENYSMGDAQCTPFKLDSNIFTGNAGKYSVSRLNILIGQILTLIWFIIISIHYVSSIICFNWNDNLLAIISIIILIIIPIAFLFALITAICNKWAKSGSLTNDSDVL